ncbi:MAG: methyltransferase domain-containing protein [Pseudonocardiaceae bacterium]|nr:methyltransferase domain-containing protein [Pseudonocardiaceae bacterium]
MSGHSHDGLDWAALLGHLRQNDELNVDTLRELAGRLVGPQTRRVVDVGSGAGGMSTAFAEAMSGAGGTVELVDGVPELLDAAAACVRAAAGPQVEVGTVQADAASDELLDLVSRADLVFASAVVHHLPDQQRGIDRLAALVNPGGRLVLVEGGLEQRCLPWDLGVGEPGLQQRLLAAWGEWFRQMRAGMDGAVRLPVGWNRAMTEGGLTDVYSFSYLVDHPAPPTDRVYEAVLHWLSRLREIVGEWGSEADLDTVDQLLDPDSPNYVGGRDDVFLLTAHTVHVGTAPA